MGRKDQLVIRSTVEGFMEVVCGDWTETWPPVPPRRSSTAIQLADITPTQVDVPESFKMDSRRIKNFNADLIELSITHLILRYTHGIGKTHDLPISMVEIRKDIEEAFITGDIPPRPLKEGEISDFAIRLSTRIIKPNTVLQGMEKKDLVDIEHIARSIDIFGQKYINKESTLYLDAIKEIRKSTTTILTDILLDEHCSTKCPTTRPETVSWLGNEVRELSEKMARIVSFNIKTFMEIYKEKGMLVGS